MLPNEKKPWAKPEVAKFGSAEEAIAYYSERGMSGHVSAIERMVEEGRWNSATEGRSRRFAQK